MANRPQQLDLPPPRTYTRTEFTALQASARTGHLRCRLEGDRVVLGGHCHTVIVGQFQI